MTLTSSPAELWTAPTLEPAPGQLDATVDVPGSKSLTNRFLVLAALADTPGVLRGALSSRDADLMVGALRALGATLTEGDTPGEWHVIPATLDTDAQIDCGLAGTVMRFVPALAALTCGTVTLDGDEGARVRPMDPIIQGLRDLGVKVDDGGRGLLPITISGTGSVVGGTVEVDASGSSQFVSGLLLAAPRFVNGLTLRHTGATLPSVPHIDMTVEVLRAAGVTVDDSEPCVWTVTPGPIAGQDVRVEPDLSNAGPFLSAALVVGGTVRVPGWPSRTTQPGAMLAELLESMGGIVTLDGDVLSVTGTGEIHGIDVDLTAAGELAPGIAALAALADSPSQLRGIAHLRGHETDRLAALVTEINALGGQAAETSDGLIITPRPLHGGVFGTYHDHRMAHAGAIIGLRVPGVLVENIATTAKTLPDFTDMWSRMLACAAPKTAAL